MCNTGFSMDISTTAISDLQQVVRGSAVPENITYQISGGMGGEMPPPIKIEKGKGELNAPVYCPIDIHPPPFGGPSPGGGGGAVSFSEPVKNPLPSRDIPQNTLQYMDEQTRANYIPPARPTRDFLELGEPKIKEHRRKKYRKRILEDLLEELQTPLLLAILFFFFSLPFVTETFHKYASTYMPFLFHDGLLNTYGLTFKAILFGSAYYGLTKTVDYFALEE